VSALSYGRDQSDRFWPEPGAMTVFCVFLAMFDASLIGILIYGVLK
jgi:hypothetical protein